MLRTEKTIYLILALVIVAFGLNIVMVKYLTQENSPILVAAIRMLLAGLGLMPFVWKIYGFFKPTLKQWGFILLIGLTTVFFHHLLLGYGIVSSSVANTALILGLNPLFTALLASVFIGEKFTIKLGLGILLGFSGVFLVVTSNSTEGSYGVLGWGEALLFLSMLAYVIGTMFVKRLSASSIPTLVITAYSTLIGGILLNVGSLIHLGPSLYHQMDSSAMTWAIMFISAWGSTALGTLGWNYGIKFIGANKTAMFLNAMPFTSMVGGVVFLNEKIGLIHLTAFLLTSIGIYIGIVKRKTRIPSH